MMVTPVNSNTDQPATVPEDCRSEIPNDSTNSTCSSSSGGDNMFGATTDGSIEPLDMSNTEETLQYITKYREKEIRDKIGHFFDSDESMMTSSNELKLGKFQFGNDRYRVQPFVFVPLGYKFKDFDQIKAIFYALNISPMPDLVFSFGKNHGIVPSKNKKTLDEWKDIWRGEGTDEDKYKPTAFSSQSESSPKDAKEDVRAFLSHSDSDSENIIKVESHVENILTAIAEDFKKTLFLITEPFRGNTLSEFACKAANKSRNNTQALGLFDLGGSKASAGGDFTVLKDTTGTEEERKRYKVVAEEIKEKRNNGAWDSRMSMKDEEFRLPVPRSIFELFTVPLGETPRSVIKIDCEFTEHEKKLYDINNRVQHIPGGLANECSRILVFATRDQKLEFVNQISDACAMGYFACGSTESEMKLAIRALSQGNPLFVLAGTGPVATITQAFIEKDSLLNLYKDEWMANIKVGPFMNEGAVDEARLLISTQNGMINNFNPEANYVVNFENSCKHNDHSKHDNSRIQEIKDRITEVMATAFDFNNEIGGEKEDMRAIDLCEDLIAKIQRAETRYNFWGTIIQMLIQIILLLVIITTVKAVSCRNGGKCGESFMDMLETIGLALPILAAALQAMDKAFRFDTKYANLLVTKNSLESEKFYFRARIGPYSSFHQSQGRRYDNARTLFMEQCNKLYGECMQSDVREGALYSHADRFRKKLTNNPGEKDLMPSHKIMKLFVSKKRYEKWQGKQMKKTMEAFREWKIRNKPANDESQEMDEEEGGVRTGHRASVDDSSGNSASVDIPSGDVTTASRNDTSGNSASGDDADEEKAKKERAKKQAIHNLKLLRPLSALLEDKKDKMSNAHDGDELKRLEDHQLHYYGLNEDEINEMKRMYRNMRAVTERKIYKERYSIISIDDYMKYRLLPKQEEFQKSLPTSILARNSLQILVILLTASSTFAVARNKEEFVPIILGIVAGCEAIRNYFYLDSRSPVLHLVDLRLEQIKFDVRGLGVLDKRLPSHKKNIIDRAEQAILSNYIFLAESALKNQQNREDKDKKDLEDAESTERSTS